VLEALPVAVMVVDVADEVLLGNRAASDVGLIRDGVLAALPQLRHLVRRTRRSLEPEQADLQMPLAALGRGPAVLLARATPVGDGTVAVLLEDVTEARRLEDVRRDFVANVSHELKTPVGAIKLLAEAVSDASDDPGAIERFARRMLTESDRLARMVQQIIELSRLQGDEPVEAPHVVDVDEVIARSVDFIVMDAENKGIKVVTGGTPDLRIFGNEEQVSAAVTNLVANAVAYSGTDSTVLVTTKTADDMVEISVVDQGIGIPSDELDRIFERFYRVDPARHRSTGGTGLGLSIVKHVAATHGGDVRVWSLEGQGSTFTLSLPQSRQEEDA
jgi:two-component system sensor histidine kinase SenX3